MESNETFEAVSHPLRIRILKLLAEKPMGFSELKRELGIKSSGKLDFHIKKMKGLVTIDSNGKYILTKDGYAALQAITVIRRYGWQKRAYLTATITYLFMIIYITWTTLVEGFKLIYIAVLVISTLWYIYYSYWSIVKRRIFKIF